MLSQRTTHAWSILLSSLPGFVLYVTQINGLSLMNQFDALPTGIPLDQISRTIEINLLQTLVEARVLDPVQPINNECVM